ncbi:hypothetical protein IQ06DRAFT_350672 [Phaeosphaeriaceae sp. SRC1lsM3a]|nr:hypothetical protein IQ06DRAFT_350672 [Stagonospora sp. SRC1lsM3a]
MYFSILTAAAILSATVAALPAGNDAPDATCLAICYLQEPTCTDFGFAKKEENSPCWTCCKEEKAPEPTPPADAFCQAICHLQKPTCNGGFAKKEDNSPCWTCCFDKDAPAPPPPTNTVCQAICHPEKPTCEQGMFAKKEDNSPCWTCCKEEPATTTTTVPGSVPAPTTAPGCPARY